MPLQDGEFYFTEMRVLSSEHWPYNLAYFNTAHPSLFVTVLLHAEADENPQNGCYTAGCED